MRREGVRIGYFIFFFVLAVFAAGWAVAQRQGAGPSWRTPDTVEVLRGIPYATTPEQELELDLYLPKVRPAEPLPLVVYIHGGAWIAGNRDRSPAAAFAAGGYVTASISYRLTDKAIFPAQIHDCKAAIRWLRAHAADYHIDPERIGVWGPSAGGHLAALLGTSAGVEAMEGSVGVVDQRSDVQAVVDFFGPTDLLQMDAAGSSMVHDAADSPESRLVGGPIQEHPDRVAVANPITYISSGAPPFLIVHGDRDLVVPHHQSVLLDAALREAGVDVTFYTVRGGGHSEGKEFMSGKLEEMTLAFFDRHLKPTVGR